MIRAIKGGWKGTHGSEVNLFARSAGESHANDVRDLRSRPKENLLTGAPGERLVWSLAWPNITSKNWTRIDEID